MIDYNELYESLRKEKYSDQLQALPKDFVEQFGKYLKEKREEFASEKDFFDEAFLKEKKQFENSISIFKELMLRRKKKILQLVFVASETGIMKTDYGNMLGFEQEIFESLNGVIDKSDKRLNELLNSNEKKDELLHKMVIMNEDVGELVDMSGETIGPFKKGELVNLDSSIADLLIGDGKAKVIDD